jgi:hypothetical protein
MKRFLVGTRSIAGVEIQKVLFPKWRLMARLAQAEEQAFTGLCTVHDLAWDHRTTRRLLYVSLALNSLSIGLALWALLK